MADLDPISAVHQAVEDRLKVFFPKWHMEPVPAVLTLQEFTTLMGRTPWIGIAWTGFTPDAKSGRQLHGSHVLRLTMALKNPGRGGRFTGDQHAPGLYPAFATLIGALQGHTLPGHGTIAITKADQSFADGYGDKSVALGIVEISVGPQAFSAPFGALADAPAFVALVATYETSDGATVTDTISMGSP
ncbi:hypothetical protein [Azorhizobium caulinodans]|uniref:hypothetical protein n=1 Tax=Azorhizobium caulinodans TaxID=7 RepID=UPI002FBDB0A3